MRINLKSLITCLLLVTIILFLIFCERSEADELKTKSSVLDTEWKVSGEPAKNISLFYSEFYGDLFNDSYVPKNYSRESDIGRLHAAYGNKIYYISNIQLAKDGEFGSIDSQRIQIYDCNKKELTTNYCIEGITAKDLNISGGKMIVTYSDISERLDNKYVSELWEDGTLLKGHNTGVLINTDILSGRNLQFETTVYEASSDRFITLCAGGEIVVTNRFGYVVVFFNGEKGVTRKPLFQTKDGIWIFKETGSHDQIEYFYINDNIHTTLYRGKELYISSAIETEDGNIIYRKTGEGDFIKWNVKTGEREIICSFEPSLVRDADFAFNDDGDLFVYKDNDLRVFSKEVKTRTIKIRQVTSHDYNVDRAIKEYQDTHPGVVFEYVNEKTDGKQIGAVEAMKKGEVDIAFLDNESFLECAEAGCIRDISDIYTEEDMANMFDSFLAASTVDGKMLRYPSFNDRNLLIAKTGVLPKSYSATDLVDLLDKKDKEGKSYEALCYGGADPFGIFLCAMDVSEFLDFQKGTCNFTAGNFERILKQCKKYSKSGMRAPYTDKEKYDDLLADKVLFISMEATSLTTFDEMKKLLGEKSVIAGYPTKAESGNITDYHSSLVVSKNSKNYDLISDFLKYLYRNYWNTYGFSDIPTDKASFDGLVIDKGDTFPIDKRVYEIPEGYSISLDFYQHKVENPVLRVMSNGYMDLAERKDGKSYADDYMDYCISLRLRDERFKPIEEILLKEVELMYQNDTDEKEVAQRIQSQVGEYLKNLK